MIIAESHKPIDILVVEDNPGDVELIRESFEGAAWEPRFHVAADGEKALAFLQRKSPFADAPRPDLIFLDLNLPKKDGRQVLQEIKADRTLTAIPVIVLTTSRSIDDILTSYRFHANCYMSKPTDLDEFLEKMKLTQQYWFTRVEIPEHEKGRA
jgi:chemotaxis family two-component system response regulator Rcp1